MGKIYPDLAGAFRRSVGGTVYYMRYGENLVRRKAVPNENRKSSLEQEKQQQRFGIINALGAMVKGVVNMGFPQRKRNLSGVNMFVHLNTDVWKEEGDEVAVDFTKLVLAKGSLLVPVATVALNSETTTITFTCPKFESENNAKEDDRIYGVVIDPKNGFCRCHELCKRGTGGEYSFILPDSWDIAEVQMYVFALSSDGKYASKSLYVKGS